MCYNAKSSISAFILITIIAVFLWYRNSDYDRMLSPFVFALGLIQLIEYGVYNNLEGNKAGKLIYMTLWLQILVLAIGAYWYLRSVMHSSTSVIAGVWLIVAAIFFIIGLYVVFGSENTFSSGSQGGHLTWSQNGGSILGGFSWVYLLGLALPFVLLLIAGTINSIGIWILLAYAILSAIFIYIFFPGYNFASMWCYSAIGFAFLAWLVGAFTCA